MGHKILVVDDEPDVLLLCRVNLEFEGYDVIEANDGAEALEILADREDIDLVLLDVMMPGVDGWQVLDQIRSNSSLQDVPVVMLTAKVQQNDQIKGLAEGAVAYVTKPFNPIALSKTLKEALDATSAEELDKRRSQMLGKMRFLKT